MAELKFTGNEVGTVRIRVVLVITCLLLILSAGSWLLLTLRQEDSPPGGATIVWLKEELCDSNR